MELVSSCSSVGCVVEGPKEPQRTHERFHLPNTAANIATIILGIETSGEIVCHCCLHAFITEWGVVQEVLDWTHE